MKWNVAYRDEIADLFAEAAEHAAMLPAPLGELGQALLIKANPLASGESSNYITFLLPFWMQETIRCPDRLCRDLAVGNVFAMVHYFLLDDVMDAGAGTNRLHVREALALGQLFQCLFQQYYGRHYAMDSPLWDHYRAYTAAWASAVSREGERPADPRNAAQLAAKSALVKLCAAGILLHAGKEAGLREVEEAVDLVLATQQLVDDWADWREDLAEDERCNAFLTLVREQLQLPPEEPLDERKVKQAVYRAYALDRLAEIAAQYGERLKRLPLVPAPLLLFQTQMAGHLRQDAEDAAETTRKLALEGGLFYSMSETVKK